MCWGLSDGHGYAFAHGHADIHTNLDGHCRAGCGGFSRGIRLFAHGHGCAHGHG